MKTWVFQKVLAAGLLFSINDSKAQPVAFGYQVIHSCKIYKDAAAHNVFYYEPSGYKLASGSDGKPTFTLLQMRYTGTQVGGDRGSIKYKNILQFKMVLDDSAVQQLQEVKKELLKSTHQLFLKPMPVTSFQSLLVYTPVNNADSALTFFTNGYTEGTETANGTSSYWSERTFSIRLSDEDAQLVESALHNDQAAMSLSYAIYTTFSAKEIASFSATVNNRVQQRVRAYFDSALIDTKDSLLRNVLVRADAIPLQIDLQRWPDAIQKIDINEKLPPAYPLFDVYCYDFNNAIRPDLYAKKIEISATSVNGSAILNSSTFKQSQPGLYVQSIRFPFAVRFDKPYKFRTTEITLEGEIKSSDWVERTSWSDIIDITTKQ
jgi:hypothetical protein